MDTITEERPLTTTQLFSALTQAWNAHDVIGISALLHPAATYISPSTPEPLKGDSILAFLQSLLGGMPDSKVETVTEEVVNSTLHVSQLVASGTWTKPFTAGPLIGIPPTGRATRIACACFIEVRDGKIFTWTQYFDRMALLSQLGIIKTP